MSDRGDDRERTGADPDHAVAALERLVGGVAHDLNNLSTAIRASVDTLRAQLAEGAAGEDAAAASLDRIDRAADQSSALMGALAAFGRREAQPAPSEMNAVLSAGGQFLRRALGTEVDLELPDPMTASASITSDLAMLVRALIQLCGRAAVESGRIRLSSSGREIVVELSPRAPRGGSVVPTEDDLANARDLLASFDARLHLSFADGNGGWDGSIRMPSAPAPPSHVPRAPVRGRPAEHVGHALVAEDHDQVREALVDALSRCGFSVDAVKDGDTLVDRGLAERDTHDVLLIDYDLPGRDGASALEALRDAGIDTPALMISGNIDFRPRLDRLENTDFLQKPFGLSDIRDWATRQIAPLDPETPSASVGGTPG